MLGNKTKLRRGFRIKNLILQKKKEYMERLRAKAPGDKHRRV